MSFRCLIDTNVFFQLEEPAPSGLSIRAEFAELSRLCLKHGVRIFIHPISKKDFADDPNETRKKNTTLLFDKYPVLESPPYGLTPDLEALFGGIGKSNDLIDSQIVYAVYRNAVNYLISEDGGVHTRARRAGLNGRVFSVKEFCNHLRQLFEPDIRTSLPSVEDLPIYSLNRADSVFESIRKEYSGFDAWFEKICLEGRRSWVVRTQEKISAVCIYKGEGSKDAPSKLGNKVLKLCTFKVADAHRGGKLGELLLKSAFLYASENNIDSIYLTTFVRDEYFMLFLKDFGFKIHPEQTPLGELIFYKTASRLQKPDPTLDPLKFHILYSPEFRDDSEISKYVIPIRPAFHELLFPEVSQEKQMTLLHTTSSIPGNTIKKVYLCHSPIKVLDPGGLMLFYRSEDIKAVTSVGIVEGSHRVSDLNQAISLVGKRSVYSLDQIEKMLSKETLIIEFRLIKHLKTVIPFKELMQRGTLKAPPQAILKVENSRYKPIVKIVHS